MPETLQKVVIVGAGFGGISAAKALARRSPYLRGTLDTSTPSGRAMFQLLGVFAEFERAMIRSRVVAGLNRVRGQKRLGRPPMAESKVEETSAS